MSMQSPDFYTGERACWEFRANLIADATPEQIAQITTLYDVLGDPAYEPDDSEYILWMGKGKRYFGCMEWRLLWKKFAAVMRSESAFSLEASADWD